MFSSLRAGINNKLQAKVQLSLEASYIFTWKGDMKMFKLPRCNQFELEISLGLYVQFEVFIWSIFIPFGLLKMI